MKEKILTQDYKERELLASSKKEEAKPGGQFPKSREPTKLQLQGCPQVLIL